MLIILGNSVVFILGKKKYSFVQYQLINLIVSLIKSIRLVTILETKGTN